MSNESKPGSEVRISETDVRRILDRAFSAEGEGELCLRTDVGPSGNGDCDWCFWTEIEVR